MAVPTVNVTCTVTNQTGAVVPGATVTAQLTGIDLYGTSYIFPSVQSFVTDGAGLVTMPLFPNALGARRTAYQFIATDPVTGRALINITAVVPNQNIDLSVLDAINRLPAYAPPLTQPFSVTLASLASLGVAVGSILFGGSGQSVLQDNANLFWDNTAKRLGIGNAAPTVALDVTGAIKTSTTLTASTSVVTPLVGTDAATNFQLKAGGVAFWEVVQSAANFRPTSDNALDLGSATNRVRTGYFGTSVVTALMGTSTDVRLDFQIGGASRWVIFPSGSNYDLYPSNADNTQSIGSTANRVKQVFTPIIDSGTTGSLSLKTNNGTTGLQVVHRASADSPVLVTPGQNGVINTAISTAGGAPFQISVNAQSIYFATDAPTVPATVVQFQVLHTASSSRNITVTGSNGGNPVLNTTAGGLDLSSATIRFPNIGTTAVAANATLNAVGSNDLLRSTSSKRYKTEIEALSRDEALTLLRKLNPITYASLSEHDDPYLRHSGFIAEEVFDINPLFVSLSNKRPESVQYERLTVPLVAGWQDHDTRLAALEARIH